MALVRAGENIKGLGEELKRRQAGKGTQTPTIPAPLAR
jgi:hypothetical protein